MKTVWLHQQGYRDLPADLRTKYESVWVTPPNAELCDPEKVHQYLEWNFDELEFADDCGFDGIGTNEHHSNGYGFPVSPHITGGILARRKSDAAVVLLGTTLPLYPPLRVAEELALIDCMSGGRLVAGWPVGSAMDTTGVWGIPPDEVRPRYYEAHDFIKQAWSRPGPFPFNGKYTKFRNVNPWPTPIQKPPPIWLAGGGSLETFDFAAKNNYAYNYLSFQGYNAAKGQLDHFWDVIEKAGLDDNPYRAGFAQAICVADTDAEAKRLFAPHVESFYEKSLHIPKKFSVVPGYQTRASFENLVRKSEGLSPFAARPGDVKQTWDTIVEKSQSVVAGSPETVADKLIELSRNLRIGHLVAVMQIQSMDTDLTKSSTKLFADKVLPRLREVWAKEGYEDHWWPKNATRGSVPAPATVAGGVR